LVILLNDMNTDIDKSNYIVIQKRRSKVGKQSVEVIGSLDLFNTNASTLSPEAGERAEEGRRR
jgi:hypothetical protein